MPIKIDSVFYELALHDEDFAAALRKAAADLDQLDSTAKKTDKSLGGMENGVKSLKKELKDLATSFAAGLAIREFIANTVDAQDALAQLQAALKSTGGAAGFTLPELVKMSEEMAKLSTFSDEAVKGGLSRLLTYTGIQGPMFKEAARATLDFAAALRIDVNSAAERVGNALQYPTEAINSLTKQGFRFTAEQKRLIAAFEDTGQLAKAQAIILGELDLAYKGSAEAARSTLGGALIALKNSFMDTLEVSKESSSGLIEAINSVADAMPSLRNKFSDFFGGISLMAVDASIRVQKFLNLFRRNKVTDEELEAFRADETARILGLNQPTAPTGRGTPGGTTPRGLTDAQLQAQRSARLAFEQAVAGQTMGAADNFETEVQKLVAAAQKAHLGATEIGRMVGELRAAHAKTMAEEGQKLALSLQGQLAQLTTTTVDELRAQLAEFDRTIEEQRSKGVPIDPTVVNQLRAAKEQAIALAPEVDAIAAALERINATAKEGANLGGPLTDLGALIERATAVRDAIRDKEGTAVGQELEGSVALQNAQKTLNTLIEREAEIRKQIRAIILASGTESQKFAVTLGNAASQIANIANVAFGLASAFGGANSELARMLGSTAQIAGGISDIADKASKLKGGFGELFSSRTGIISALPGIGQAIGGAVALASSLFGKSPEEIERLRLMKENNQQLARLRDKIGDLAKINVLGTQLGQFGGFLSDPRLLKLLNNPASAMGSQDAINRQIGAILDSLGLSGVDLKEFAKSFGITVGTGAGGKITLDDIRQLQEAIKNSELNQFADDFTGQMQRLDAEIKLFNLTKPIDQFEEFRKVINSISGGPGALGDLIKNFDLTTSAGLEAARKAVQELFNQFQALPTEQLAGFLGGLSPEQFLDAIGRLTDFINAQAAGGGVAGTGGFNVDRTITEVTGSRLASFAERTARATELTAALLGGGPLPTINAPSIAAPAGALGNSIVFESITIEVGAGVDPSQGQAAGAAAGESFIDTIDRQLGSKIKWQRRAKGLTS